MSDRFDLLADRLAERVADRVGEILDERDAAPPPLLDASGAARYLGVDRSAVYVMAKDGRLPVVKLGDSDRPRLRFDPRALADHLAADAPESAQSNGRRRRPAGSVPSADLLPIRNGGGP
ncbi:MAG: helix-turn-helix domain-containing protein [Actinomycetota bacterium]